MLGLALGSWLGGRYVGRWTARTRRSPLFFYALVELFIGLGAFLVPGLFGVGEGLLLASGETDSFRYLFLSALVITASILPWTICMGATFPLVMAYIRERGVIQPQSFSFLYLANVLGAMCGTLLTAVVFVELLGFHHTLWLAASGNFIITVLGLWLARQEPATEPAPLARSPAESVSVPDELGASLTRGLLFLTGFAAMAMEVVWTRAFCPVLKTQVYSFALILFTYLGATFLGTWIYRRHRARGRTIANANLIPLLAMSALIPVLVNDPRWVNEDYLPTIINFGSMAAVLGSICPFCAVLGYLTPNLIDGYSGGDPVRAGKVYAINILGCILGPLCACYLLLPHLSERHALVLLALPFVVCWLLLFKKTSRRWQWGTSLLMAVLVIFSSCFARDFTDELVDTQPHTAVRRDYAASVISFGEGFNRHLLVNGIGMTKLTPITKFMVHLPLALHQDKPQSALIICFGMGTSYRAAMSWGLDTTAVELIPDVPRAFGFYHADADSYLHATNSRIIVDDGRRFLRRTDKKFDVIVIDPPPPVEAAGSSLLYSTEFCQLAKEHLKPGGILQTWFPGGELATAVAVVRSTREVFPYARYYPSIEGWGIHVVASVEPLTDAGAKEMLARVPDSARHDLMEWAGGQDALEYFSQVATNGHSIDDALKLNSQVRITDDEPFNEYFLLRRWLNSDVKQ
jgi:spermidine synthase